MSPVSEIDAITTLENTLSQLEDPVARDRVLKWAWDKFSSNPSQSKILIPEAKKQSLTKRTKKSRAKTKSSPSIVKNLNLNPEGKRSFKDFVQEKKPPTNQEKCTVAIYFLHNELKINNISLNHIFTCYKDANWKIPDLYNVLMMTSSKKGWIDTSNMEDISITTHGDNLVEFDLPSQAKSK